MELHVSLKPVLSLTLTKDSYQQGKKKPTAACSLALCICIYMHFTCTVVINVMHVEYR